MRLLGLVRLVGRVGLVGLVGRGRLVGLVRLVERRSMSLSERRLGLGMWGRLWDKS